MNIYILCTGGFSNRLNSLTTGIIISKQMKIKPILIWPKCNYCDSYADKIFNINFLEDNFLYIKNDLKLPNIKILSHKKDKYKNDKFSSIYFWPFLKKNILKEKDSFIVESDLPPWWINIKKYKLTIQKIKYSEVVNNLVRRIKEDSGKLDYGLHVRQGDWGNSASILINSLNKISYLKRKIFVSNKKIYVSSDSEIIPKVFKNIYPLNVVNSSLILTDYAFLTKDQKAYNSENSIVQGIAEQIVLSSTRLYATSFSSFLYSAFLRSNNYPASFFDWIHFQFIIPFQYSSIQFNRLTKLQPFLKKIFLKSKIFR